MFFARTLGQNSRRKKYWLFFGAGFEFFEIVNYAVKKTKLRSSEEMRSKVLYGILNRIQNYFKIFSVHIFIYAVRRYASC